MCSYFIMPPKRKYQPKLNFRKRKRTKFVPKKRTFAKRSKRYAGKRKSMFGAPRKSGTHGYIGFGKGIQSSRKPFIHKMWKVLAPNQLGYCDSGYVNIPQGKQAIICTANAYTPYDLVNRLSVTAATRYMMDKCFQKTTYTNQNNFNVFVDIYDCLARKDCSDTSFDPTNTITQSATASGGAFTAPGQSIYQAQVFTGYFKILKKTSLCMGSGETYQHVVTHKPRRIVKGPFEVEFVETLDKQSIGNLTYYQLAVVYGGPVDLGSATTALTGVTTGGVDSGNADATKLNVPHISWITSKTYTLSVVTDFTTNNAFTNNLTTNTNFATYKTMEDDGDANVEVVA